VSDIGKNRQEQAAWVSFRSHFLFESEYVTLGRGQEKGGVENLVGYVRRNFLVPLPDVQDFAGLNAWLPPPANWFFFEESLPRIAIILRECRKIPDTTFCLFPHVLKPL